MYNDNKRQRQHYTIKQQQQADKQENETANKIQSSNKIQNIYTVTPLSIQPGNFTTLAVPLGIIE